MITADSGGLRRADRLDWFTHSSWKIDLNSAWGSAGKSLCGFVPLTKLQSSGYVTVLLFPVSLHLRPSQLCLSSCLTNRRRSWITPVTHLFSWLWVGTLNHTILSAVFFFFPPLSSVPASSTAQLPVTVQSLHLWGFWVCRDYHAH